MAPEIQLLRDIREQDFLSDDLRARIDEHLHSAAADLEQTRQGNGESYEDLVDALNAIDTAAVFLPGFKVTHEGGMGAVVMNIVEAMQRLSQQPGGGEGTCVAAAATGAEPPEPPEPLEPLEPLERAENIELRRMLCLAHAGVTAYFDDGEAQDASAHPAIDFLRDDVATLREKLRQRAAGTSRVGAPASAPAFASGAGLRADARQAALDCCAEVERELIEVANRTRKAGNLSLRALIKLIGYVRDAAAESTLTTGAVAPGGPPSAGSVSEEVHDRLCDSAWIAGAKFGWNCGLAGTIGQLNAAIELRVNERVAACAEGRKKERAKAKLGRGNG